MHAIIYQVDFILSAAHDRGKITEKAVILVSQKEKESRNIAAKPPMLIDANTPSTGLQELIKKSSHDTLLLDKGSSKDFLVEMGGVDLPCGAGRLGLKRATGTFLRALGSSSLYMNKNNSPSKRMSCYFGAREET